MSRVIFFFSPAERKAIKQLVKSMANRSAFPAEMKRRRNDPNHLFTKSFERVAASVCLKLAHEKMSLLAGRK